MIRTCPRKSIRAITTEITGEGGSAAPQNDATLAEDRLDYEHYGIKPDWKTFREYFARLERQGIGINLASYVGATQVRRVVIGNADRAPTAAELEEMKRLVRQAMEEGTRGVSTALEYAPAPYASTDELIALAAESAKYGGLYATHMRNEGSGIMAALEETARIAREANTPVEIWHLKVAGVASWGHMPEVVKFIDDARASGLDIAADTYAYTAWNNSMSAFIPPWAHDGGDEKLIERLKDPATRARIRKDMMTPTQSWDNEWQEIPGPDAILISSVLNPDLLPLQGKRISEIAKMWAVPSHGPASHEPRAVRPTKDPIDTICDLLIQDHAATYVSVFGMQEGDVELALKQPWVSVDNDSSGTSPEGILGQDHPHPRAYGTFPRILAKFVREEKLLTLPDAIRKFTALPAQRMRITDRGVLKAGNVGGHRDLRSRHDSRRRDFRESESVVRGHEIRHRQWHARYRRRENDQRRYQEKFCEAPGTAARIKLACPGNANLLIGAPGIGRDSVNHVFCSLRWRHVSSRLRINFSRSRPHFVCVITFSMSSISSGSPIFSRNSLMNGCTLPNIKNISPLTAGRRNNSSLNAPCSTNAAAIPQ